MEDDQSFPRIAALGDNNTLALPDQCGTTFAAFHRLSQQW
jgi:hypothetical protein